MYDLFSADDHVIEHPLVWTSRVPARTRTLKVRGETSA